MTELTAEDFIYLALLVGFAAYLALGAWIQEKIDAPHR